MARGYDGDIQLTVDLTPGNVIQTAKDLNEEVRQIFSDAKSFDMSESFRALQMRMDEATVQARDLLIEIDALSKAHPTAHVGGTDADSQRYTSLLQQLNQVNNSLVISTARANQALDEVANSGESAGHRIIAAFSKIGSFVGSALTSSFVGLANAVKFTLRPAELVVKKFSELAGSAIKSGIKKLGQSISQLGKHTHSSNDIFNKGFKSFIRYGLGVRSVFALINKLRRALIEGFGNLAQFSDPFNRSVSNILTALNTLKNSFASAFSPIIEVVSPILTHFINLIAEAVTKVGMLIATLTGKSSYARALPVYQDYAASVDKTAKNSSKAAKATKDQNKQAKELKKTLAGFDDIEILQDDKSSDSGSGSGSGAGADGSDAVQSAFANVPIESAFSDLANKIKEAWAKADFTEIGRMIGEKLKGALESIPWDKIQAVLRKVAKSIATLLNGFLETPGLFTTIGKTLAMGINSAFEFVESFVSNFHWNSLGIAVKDLILGALNNIDWKLIYKTMKELGAGIGTAIESALDDQELWIAVFTAFSRGLNSVVYAIQSFLTSVNWGSIAANIGKGLNAGVQEFDWNALADTLSTLVNDVFDILYNFVSEFDFTKFGQKIGHSLSRVIKTINWKKGGYSLALTITKLFNALNGFLEETDFGEIGHSIADAIAGFLKGLDWSEFASFFSLCFRGLFDTLTGIVERVDWEALPGQIADAIKSYLLGFDWEGMATSVGGLIGAAFKAIAKVGGVLWNEIKSAFRLVISGGWEGIKSKLADVGSWIKKHIFDPFIDGFKSAFGISSPAKNMEPYGEYVMQGIYNGIVNIIKNIKGWIYLHLFKPFIDAIKTFFGIGSEESGLVTIGKDIVNALLGGITAAMEGIADWIAENIVGPILEGLHGLVDGVHGLFDGTEDTLKVEYFEDATEVMGDYTESLSYLTEVVENSSSDTAWSKLRTAIEELHKNGSISTEVFDTLSTVFFDSQMAGMPLDGTVASIAQHLADAGVPADKLNEVLGLLPDNANNASEGLNTLKDSAGNTDTETTELQDAIKGFNKLSWTAPIKIALISGAISSLEESGKLSKEEVETLQSALDEYDANPTEKTMKKIIDAFDDTSISASDFKNAIVDAANNAPEEMRPGIDKILNKTKNLKTQMGTDGRDAGKDFTGGLATSIKDGSREVENQSGLVINRSIFAMREVGRMHSPSEETRELGEYLIDGLRLGMEDTESELLDSVTSILSNVVDEISVKVDDFNDIGQQMVSSLANGLQSYSGLTSIAYNIGYSVKSSLSVDGWTIGTNICTGIYNGLMWGWQWLTATAWNLALSVYYSACNALGIHSPSRLFKEKVGKMIPAGIAAGIDENTDDAVSAMGAMADDLNDAADDVNTTFEFNSSINDFLDTIDGILSTFSDKILSGFDTLINAIDQLNLPDIVQGKVVPYGSTNASNNSQSASISRILDKLDANKITPEELRGIITDAFKEYLDISFYIGDEQVYRHAQKGALKLERRYNPVMD